jgi:hypothetical protein
LAPENDGGMCVSVLPGRQTYVVGVCADWLVANWERSSEKDRAIIQRDLEEAFEQDDRDRKAGDNYKRLGHDCDRKEWERVPRTLEEQR